MSVIPFDPRPAGDRGLLLQLDDNTSVHALARAARARFGDALQEVVPGHTTLLLVWNQTVPSAEALMSDLNVLARSASTFRSDLNATVKTDSDAVGIPVVYDGDDLERVADALELGVEALTELHAGTAFTVAFMGFAPGFPYLIAQDGGRGAELLALPRLATPRTEVPAGSVAVAAGYCGIYPGRSPGGWNLLGRTPSVLFDSGRERPALLEPGMAVRFVAA